ncbi:hypothetical protein [Shimazuella alba]|uniref:Uncharacterized protein n=1 Tax=Shimazuella alba TaxID=2690964 RepID=A0A6I4VQD5_9BACL|nr:hypothetical protein [Shimazuella alba]MXQ53293.1 hypothetical protein [Shimazuella alba]
MQIRDQQTWDERIRKNVNDEGETYCSVIVDFAERWTDLMEAKMASGARLEDIAKETRKQDNTGLFGFQYYFGLLVDCWEHGEALLQWSNSGSQTGMERGNLGITVKKIMRDWLRLMLVIGVITLPGQAFSKWYFHDEPRMTGICSTVWFCICAIAWVSGFAGKFILKFHSSMLVRWTTVAGMVFLWWYLLYD